MSTSGYYSCGPRGCAALTKRNGVLRYCCQPWMYRGTDGRSWCFYHNPLEPKRFGSYEQDTEHARRQQELLAGELAAQEHDGETGGAS